MTKIDAIQKSIGRKNSTMSVVEANEVLQAVGIMPPFDETDPDIQVAGFSIYIEVLEKRISDLELLNL